MLVTSVSGGGAVPADDAVSARGRIALTDFTFIALQLLLVLVVLRQFQIEGKAFVELAAYSFVGFGVHAFLPLRLRLPFFALLSLGSIAFVLGAANALWIIAIGGVLVALCHLPVAPRWRLLLLVAVGLLLVAQRSKWLPVPWSEAIWPILGSMFMFRLILYFYDLTHDKAPVTAAQSVSYFAMLPNVCFTLFPVIDFKTYRRSHYALEAPIVYQKGVDWIARGIVHLILYRCIYYYVTLAPAEVHTPADLLQYIFANFMMYLKVSGMFHMIVGMLHLFGFNLPETHNRYLLAASLTDHWRRINIYWKDFMQKVFYFPAVLALRKLGTTWAMALAIMYVFFLTWFLHSYQWFWLRGTWLLEWQDVLFWAILGLMVVFNSLYEARYGRTRKLKQDAWSLRSAAAGVAKAFGIFWLIGLLWSFWTIDSIATWLSMWSAMKGEYTFAILIFPGIVLALITLGSIPTDKVEAARVPAARRRLLWRDRAVTAAMLIALLVVSIEAVHTRFGTTIATAVHSLRAAKLSRLDGAKLERGYYEGLMNVGGFNSELWSVYNKRPDNWLAVDLGGLKRFTDNFAQNELIPSAVSPSQYGIITTNRFGLRDRDYTEARPPGTLRIAVLGSSSVMGWGVGDGHTFEALLEERLAREPLDTGFSTAELLNYGVPGYQPPQQLVNFERSLKLNPNAMMYIATGRELSRSADYLAEVVRKRIPIPYPALKAIVDEAGVSPDMDRAAILKKLEPLRARILTEVYGRLGEQARERRIAPLWAFLPQVQDGPWREETADALRIAQAAGFSILNMDNVFEGHAVEKIRLAEWDLHPNALAHRILADRLYSELQRGGPALFESAAR